MILFNGQTVTLVGMSLMGSLFNFVLSDPLQTRNTHVLQLSVDHQGDCFTSCENIISTFIHFSSSQTLLLCPPSHGIDPVHVHVNGNVQPEGVKPILYSFVPLKKRLLLLVLGITDNKMEFKNPHLLVSIRLHMQTEGEEQTAVHK